MNVKPVARASCHPEKPLHGKQLCAACYQRSRRLLEGPKLAHRAANKRWKAKHPEERLHLERRYRYRLSKVEYQNFQDRAGGRCEICGVQPKKLCMDHDHKTKRVRGMLCDRCNKALGAYEYMNAFPQTAAYLNATRIL